MIHVVLCNKRSQGVYNLFHWQLICSYVFNPIEFMRTDVSDCRKVAELHVVGINIFTNEFLAYKELSVLIANKQNLTDYTAQ